MKPISIMFVGLAAACLWAARVPAECKGHGPMGGPGAMRGGPGALIPLLIRGGDLNADQKQKVQEILSADRESVHALFGQLRDANNQLADKLVGANQPQTAEVTPLVQNIVQLRTQLAQHELNTVMAIRAVLTPDQLAKAASRKDQLRQLQQQKHALFANPQ